MRLFLRDRRLDLEPGRPALMGIINANHDSVSDRTRLASLEAQVRRAEEMVQAGATLIDVGAESGRTDQAPRRSGQERALLLPLVEALVKGGITVSVDTWKFEVAASAIGAGAHLINDVSGLADERLAELAAASGAGLVLMHTRAAP
ncbi:MAG: hypothetical protein DLM61_16420 [Pseudonocardiales bacterium]|nr:MAG: hypothetical protein DLM61_16420 [Pseudonocardiales bacterium]